MKKLGIAFVCDKNASEREITLARERAFQSIIYTMYAAGAFKIEESKDVEGRIVIGMSVMIDDELEMPVSDVGYNDAVRVPREAIKDFKRKFPDFNI